MMEKYTPGLGIAAGAWMLKWDQLSQHLRPFEGVRDCVHVYLNFECILKNLTTYKRLGELITYYRQDVVLELESSIINLLAHYRGYFLRQYKEVNVYFYYTDLESDLEQEMTSFNKYYRSYYKNRYLSNPQFRDMSDLLLHVILPEIALILSYLPGCYFVRSKGFDSSVVPALLADMANTEKGKTIDHVVISGDVFDSQYLFRPEFQMVYIKRRFQHFGVSSTVSDTVTSIVKNESPFDLAIFNSELYFKLLLSIKGSKIRNIKSAKGFGYGKFMNLLKEGLERGIVLRDFSSIGSITELFPTKYREDIVQAFRCINLDTQIAMTNEADRESIQGQLIDKSDIESVQKLNDKRFVEYPLKLIYLI